MAVPTLTTSSVTLEWTNKYTLNKTTYGILGLIIKIMKSLDLSRFFIFNIFIHLYMKQINFEKLFNYIKLFTLFSVFTGILYQYISLKWNIAFFSYSEVINDSILAIPIVMTYLLSLYGSYFYINFYIKIEKRYKLNKIIYSLFGVVLNLGVALFMYKYIIFHSSISGINNILELFLFLFFGMASLNTLMHITTFESIKNIQKLYIILGVGIYLITLSTINKAIYDNFCFISGNELINVDYVNDTYVFTDNWAILSMKTVDGFLRNSSCK